MNLLPTPAFREPVLHHLEELYIRLNDEPLVPMNFTNIVSCTEIIKQIDILFKAIFAQDQLFFTDAKQGALSKAIVDECIRATSTVPLTKDMDNPCAPSAPPCSITEYILAKGKTVHSTFVLKDGVMIPAPERIPKRPHSAPLTPADEGAYPEPPRGKRTKKNKILPPTPKKVFPNSPVEELTDRLADLDVHKSSLELPASKRAKKGDSPPTNGNEESELTDNFAELNLHEVYVRFVTPVSEQQGSL